MRFSEVFGFNSMHYVVIFRLKGSRSLQSMLGGSSQGPRGSASQSQAGLECLAGKALPEPHGFALLLQVTTRCFAEISFSYLNVNTYRSISGARKSSWFFYEHSVLLFLSCVSHRTSKHQESNLLWMIRNTFFFLVFQKAVHINGMLSVRRVAVLHIVTKVSCSSLFFNVQEKKINQCQQPRLVTVISFITSKMFDPLKKEIKISSCIF